jgi:hypothetical protein
VYNTFINQKQPLFLWGKGKYLGNNFADMTGRWGCYVSSSYGNFNYFLLRQRWNPKSRKNSPVAKMDILLLRDANLSEWPMGHVMVLFFPMEAVIFDCDANFHCEQKWLDISIESGHGSERRAGRIDSQTY